MLSGYVLYQNFPNPFVDSTSIRFIIPERQFVSLKVFDVQGRVVDTILEKEMDGGHHRVNYDAGNLESGVYFYKLSAGNISQVQKMIIIRKE